MEYEEKELDGTLPLVETSQQVADFEQIGWLLADWKIEGGKNAFRFRMTSSGLSPKPCKFVPKGVDPGSQFVRVDSGRLLVQGLLVDVVLYRLR